MTRRATKPEVDVETSATLMADTVSVNMPADPIDVPGKPAGRQPATPVSTPNAAPQPARIHIDDRPGEQTRLALAAGDLGLSITLAPAECIAVAGEFIEAARRRMGRAD